MKTKTRLELCLHYNEYWPLYIACNLSSNIKCPKVIGKTIKMPKATMLCIKNNKKIVSLSYWNDTNLNKFKANISSLRIYMYIGFQIKHIFKPDIFWSAPLLTNILPRPLHPLPFWNFFSESTHGTCISMLNNTVTFICVLCFFIRTGVWKASRASYCYYSYYYCYSYYDYSSDTSV